MKEILKKLFYPSKIVAILVCLFSIGLLTYVLSIGLIEHPLSYLAYILSTYSLIVFMIWFYKICKLSNQAVKGTKAYKTYQDNIALVLKVTLLISSIINLVYGLFKLITGIYYNSWWFITFAIYYLILWLMKILLLKDLHLTQHNLNKEYKKLRNIGIIIFLLNLVLVGMIILIIEQDRYFTYPGYLIYIIALYDFYLIITAIINVIKYRKNNSPIMYASKCMSLTVAMISILSLEVAMIYQFGNNDTNFKLVMTSCTGFGIALINTIMAITMIYKGTKGSKIKS